MPSYFNFFIRNKKNKPSKIKNYTSAPSTRNNWVYDKKKKIPITFVSAPKSVKNGIQIRSLQGEYLRETSVLGHWRKLSNPTHYGKDENGGKTVLGKTFIKQCTKMIWYSGERVLVNKPLKNTPVTLPIP